jgi:1-acyl-sn-glycerol-3-phosphate acyltransferase
MSDTAGINRVVWPITYVMCKALFHGLYRLRRNGNHNIPRRGGVLLVCNHIAGLDPPMVGTAATPRRTHYMAKSELFRGPVVTRILREVGAFPVERGGADRTAMRMAKDVLARGDCLLMFPEGTRSLDGRLGPAMPGAGALALDDGVTVVPMAIWGSQRRFGPVRVEIGAPLDLSDLTSGPRSARAQAVAERMMAAIAELRIRAGAPPNEGTPDE